MRSLAPSPTAARTARTRSTSSRSPTLSFRVVNPRRTRSAARLAAAAGAAMPTTPLSSTLFGASGSSIRRTGFPAARATISNSALSTANRSDAGRTSAIASAPVFTAPCVTASRSRSPSNRASRGRSGPQSASAAASPKPDTSTAPLIPVSSTSSEHCSSITARLVTRGVFRRKTRSNRRTFVISTASTLCISSRIIANGFDRICKKWRWRSPAGVACLPESLTGDVIAISGLKASALGIDPRDDRSLAEERDQPDQSDAKPVTLSCYRSRTALDRIRPSPINMLR